MDEDEVDEDWLAAQAIAMRPSRRSTLRARKSQRDLRPVTSLSGELSGVPTGPFTVVLPLVPRAADFLIPVERYAAAVERGWLSGEVFRMLFRVAGGESQVSGARARAARASACG